VVGKQPEDRGWRFCYYATANDCKGCSTGRKIGVCHHWPNAVTKQSVTVYNQRRPTGAFIALNSFHSVNSSIPFSSFPFSRFTKAPPSSNPVAMDAGDGAHVSGSGPASLCHMVCTTSPHRTSCASPRSRAANPGGGYASTSGSGGPLVPANDSSTPGIGWHIH
jgi:hypothetical protein